MPIKRMCWYGLVFIGIGLTSSSCVVNDGEKLPIPLKSVIAGAGIGAGAGAVIGSVTGNVIAGAAVGTVAGSVVGMFNQTPSVIIGELEKRDIQFVAYGDTQELIIPTDKYFEFNSHRISDQCYIGLMNIVRLLRYYPCSTFFVAGFTDEIGSREHKNKLSQSRADAIVTFLWAHDIRAQHLKAEGYGDKNTVGDNHLIHGSAYNRRIEIQWNNTKNCTQPPMLEAIDSK